jgi:trypsin-like peptidase
MTRRMHRPRQARTRSYVAFVLGLALAWLPLPTAGIRATHVGAQPSPNASIFLVLVWRIAGRQLETFGGTGFFIAADGTALTASHVVYETRTNRTYHIAAIIGKEVYTAALICASELAIDPTKDKKAEFSRDVAEIRVTANGADSIGDLTYRGAIFATAHRGPLPQFPFLKMAAPHEGDEARTFGFGRLRAAPMPYPWSATGTVEHTFTFDDGTPGLQVRYSTPTEPGHSGSPVLNARGEVIGMHNWHSDTDRHLGTAVSSAALDPACP